MIKSRLFFAAILALTLSSGHGYAQKQFEVITGKPFDSALPKDFYLEGNAIPTSKLNAAMVRLPSGERAMFSLIDTTGYSANIIAKYIGMIITEGDLMVCGHKVPIGSYGFGWQLPGSGVDQHGKFMLYNQAGAKITECNTRRDADLQQPKPLHVVLSKDGTARLYHSRHSVELK